MYRITMCAAGAHLPRPDPDLPLVDRTALCALRVPIRGRVAAPDALHGVRPGRRLSK